MTERYDELKSLRVDVLDAIKEFRVELVEHRKMVQRGFEEIGREQGAHYRRIGALEAEVKAVRATEIDCQERLARVEMDGRARHTLMLVLIAFVIVLLLASLIQTGLWWYTTARLFHV